MLRRVLPSRSAAGLTERQPGVLCVPCATAFPRLAPALWLLTLLFGLPFCAKGQAPAAAPLAAAAAAARDGGDLSRATELYTQALAADPQWAEGWWTLGNLDYQQDQYGPARDALTRFLALKPRAVAALALRGMSEFELGSFPDSLSDIQQAIDLGAAAQPRNAQILLYHQALSLTRLGRFEEAVAQYTLFVKQGIANDDIATGLGLAGLRIAAPPKSLSPQALEVARQAGRAGFKIVQGDAAGGRQAFAQIVASSPNTPSLHYFCAYLLLTTDPDQGIDELRQELRLDPQSKPANTLLAWTLELRGDYSDALPVAQKAFQDDSTLPTNQLVLGRALLGTGDAKAALPYLDQTLAADPSNLEAHISLARAYSELGRKDEAREQRLLSIKLTKDTPRAP